MDENNTYQFQAKIVDYISSKLFVHVTNEPQNANSRYRHMTPREYIIRTTVVTIITVFVLDIYSY
jgi:hypothetical protein